MRNTTLLLIALVFSFSTKAQTAITSFTLINAETNEDLFEIQDGASIDLSSLPTSALNIRANTSGGVGSVGFELSGALVQDQTESFAPYALYGDISGNYNMQEFLVGDYLLTATPFSGSGLSGTPGTALTIQFSVMTEPPFRPFVTTWKTDNPGISGNNQITIPTFAGELYNYSVEWGDGTSSENVTGDITHTYDFPGNYIVSIYGDFPAIFFNDGFATGNISDNGKILSVDQWGDIAWRNMFDAFAGCVNLDVTALDAPNLSNVSLLQQTFFGCKALVGNESFQDWDVSNVSSMESMFAQAENFNQDIGQWNVSNVLNMTQMFAAAESFNQDIGNWNVSNVLGMGSMFQQAISFNQNIGNWNVSGVSNMSNMFSEATMFNQYIGDWEVGNVQFMSGMFSGATAFNQDIGGWNVANVVSMPQMFLRATNFDQSLENWNVGNVGQPAAFSSMEQMFNDSGLSNENYDKTLIGWSQLPSLLNGVQLDAPNNEFCISETARQNIIDTYGWTINDAGKALDCERPFITTWKTDNRGISGDNQISIPTKDTNPFGPALEYNFNVDWGDGTSSENVTGDITHTYDVPGTYTISITGQFPKIDFDFDTEQPEKDREKLLSIDQWGDILWEDLSNAFVNCSNMDVLASDTPDLSQITNLNAIFFGCSSLIGNASFEEWDMSTISDTSLMFLQCSQFNQDISGWNMSNVTNMGSMFNGASSFNQDIGNWNTDNLRDIVLMFFGASSFNQDISDWNVSSVTNFGSTFSNATSFDQDLSNWNVSNALDMLGLFANSGLSDANYDAILIGWSQLESLQPGVVLDAPQNAHCASVAERQFIIDTYGWTINDLGQAFNCGPNQQRPFITVWKTNNPGVSEANQVTIPTLIEETYDYSVDWGDGTSSESVSGDVTHTYENPGTYTISILGQFPGIYFNNEGDKQKLLTIQQWGDMDWTSLENAFYGCSEMDLIAPDTPRLEQVSSLKGMFQNCAALVGNFTISNWNTTGILDMSNMFFNASLFNQFLGSWDVSNVRLMPEMFTNAVAFNNDISLWDISKVEDMLSFLDGTAMSVENYDRLLVSWSNLEGLQQNVRFGAGGLFYCQGTEARQLLIDTYNWVILDDMRSADCPAQERPFITTWKTDNPGISGNNQITIPTADFLTYDFTIDWGDGNINENVTETITHTYEEAGVYTVSISGFYPGPYLNNGGETVITSDAQKLLTIEQWGDNQWTWLIAAFQGCTNMDVVAVDVPDLSKTTSTVAMFRWCSTLVGNSSFSNWDMSNIETTSIMFERAFLFNQNISTWNMGKVTEMSVMFQDATSFNQPIGDWDVSNVTMMTGMLSDATSFNQPLNNWDVGNVTSMFGLLGGATSFNQPLDNWNVSSVNTMTNLFFGATAFDQDLGNWDVSEVTEMIDMFREAGLSTENYDNTLIGWSQLPQLQQNVTFNAGNSQFCEGASARQNIIDTYNWVITDGGSSNSCDLRQRPFVTTWKTDNTGVSENNQITIPTLFGETYNYTVDWGDGSSSDNVTGNITHTYDGPGIYTVSISGQFPAISFDGSMLDPSPAVDDREKIISVNQWGDIAWTSMQTAFFGCSNMDVIANDTPDLSRVLNMGGMFQNCSSLIGNPSFSDWNTASVTNMTGVFNQCALFNQAVGGWDVSNVELMIATFAGATSFNQDISNWNVGNVTNMVAMFAIADSFNSDLTNWDTSSVTDMSFMFSEASSFNGKIGNWNTGMVINMSSMFSGAQAFDKDLGEWDISSATRMDGMFFNAGLSTENYDKTLMGWSSLEGNENQVPIEITFDGGGSTFCLSEASRETLINDFNWTITDAGLSCPPLGILGFNLINADNNTVIGTLVDGAVLDLNGLPANLNIEAIATSDVESVLLELSGDKNNIRTENVAPYALFGDNSGNFFGMDFDFGAYSITATPYGGNGLSGDMGAALTIDFEFVDGIPADFEISFLEVNSPLTCGGNSGEIIGILEGPLGFYEIDLEGPVSFSEPISIELISSERNFSLLSLSAGDYELKITQELTGVTVIKPFTLMDPDLPEVSLTAFADIEEDGQPFTLTGGSPVGGTYSGTGVMNGVFDPQAVGPGTYEIRYDYMDPVTNCSNSTTANITVLSDVPTVLSVVSYNLIDADNDVVIRSLSDGDIVDINTLPTLNLNIEAVTTEDVESVQLSLTGPTTNLRTENVAPFALFGDNSGDFFIANFELGNYSITARPFSSNALSGTEGTLLTIDFEFTASSAITTPANQMKVWPNPAVDVVHMGFDQPTELIELNIYDVHGRLVRRLQVESSSEGHQIQVDDLPAGMYFIKTMDAHGKLFERQVMIEK